MLSGRARPGPPGVADRLMCEFSAGRLAQPDLLQAHRGVELRSEKDAWRPWPAPRSMPDPHATSGRGRPTLELVGPRDVGYGEINWAARQAGRSAQSDLR